MKEFILTNTLKTIQFSLYISVTHTWMVWKERENMIPAFQSHHGRTPLDIRGHGEPDFPIF